MKSEWVEDTVGRGGNPNRNGADVDSWKRKVRKWLEKEDVEKGIFLATTLLFFGSMYFLGRAVAETMSGNSPKVQQTSAGVLTSENWGLGFGAEGAQPTGNATSEQLKEYNAYFVGDNSEKVIYLTFDCGYENGNTEAILDALKKHSAPATFFVVGHYLESAPDLVKRMVEEGHTVGNHTYHHPDMSAISDKDAFQKEMTDVSEKFKEVTGQEMAMYYRPPQGKYNTTNLQMAKELGYSTFFWSLAYVDWNVDSQPSHEEAFRKLTTRIHPGAVVLLHNTSKTNGEILDELLTKWEEMGYTFGVLADIAG
ncbi:MAG: delta-lactam-biosynthetic de-N-acetylase [Bacteroidales bacterium]|nr:delta-lactam-biosynthetic de-N-acetylase [Lachnoclostridium sp.]MCM1385504.1 delta-lactam-biosynthetic de-N-acetylase [Lachnoclostridium sp.]MCM1466228.1 delta-lactam-biosynthetic de-N-acetylase [Bacteroidales bacterium]